MMKDRMQCWHCATPMIWGGDHDGEEDDDYLIVSNFHCPTCQSRALVFYPNKEEQHLSDGGSTPHKLPLAN